MSLTQPHTTVNEQWVVNPRRGFGNSQGRRMRKLIARADHETLERQLGIQQMHAVKIQKRLHRSWLALGTSAMGMLSRVVCLKHDLKLTKIACSDGFLNEF